MHNKENCSPSSNGGFGANTTSATGQMQSNGGIFASLYSQLFNEDSCPSLATCNNNGGLLYAYEGLKYATDSGIHQSHSHDSSMVRQKHQDMVNSHSICLSRLVETSREVETLRQENSQLRAMNRELQKQLSLFFHASLENRFGGSSGHNTTPFDLAQGFRGLHIGDNSCRDVKENNCTDWNINNINNNDNREQEQEQEQDQEESPTSVIENNSGVEVERFTLPKSISVRSNGYLKTLQSAGTGAGSGNRNTKGDTRPHTSVTTTPEVVQKVYVHGGKKEEEALEVVVYNQGMFKTELCNKWQESGTCPYGDHCQYAHGIGELRPVIRHPRYKTAVCRMVLAGVPCPYGHRCHFRHALTEEEKVIAQHKLRTMKLER